MDAEILARLESLLADDRHVIEFKDQGWTIAHPLRERLAVSSLFDCDVRWTQGDPGLRGRFDLERAEDGVLFVAGPLVEPD